MGAVRIGPRARAQLSRLAMEWHQGEHVIVTGRTGSGKTRLVRELVQLRLDRGGSVVVFIAKLQPDETILRDYKGFVRWKTWKKHPNVTESRVLFWPDVEGKTPTEARDIMKREYAHALGEIFKVGKWCVVIDEGLYTTSPSGLGLSDAISHMFQLIRSAKGTMIICAQRPSHLPLSIYANVSQAFVGGAWDDADVKRLVNLDGAGDRRSLADKIRALGPHDFLWFDVAAHRRPEVLNLAK